MSSPFLQIKKLAEACLAELGRPELRPQEVWLTDEPEKLERVKSALLRVVQRVLGDLNRLKALKDRRFAVVTGLEEWLAIEREADSWQEEIAKLRPAANADHVKETLISIRGRISELLDQLAVRSAVRDPASDVASSTLAAETIAGLMAERDHRDLGLGLLEDGAADPWNTALEALDASVVDWGARLGPEHRIQLEQLCHKLLENLEAIARLPECSPALEKLSQAGSRKAAPLRNIYDRLLEVPSGKMDAGIASDFHYMASLAKRMVGEVRSRHGTVISDYAGQTMPPPAVALFRLLHLAVPRARKRSGTQTLSRREIELTFGRRLWSGASQEKEE